MIQTTLQRIGQRVNQQFRRYGLPFRPYGLRHAWAVRTIHYGLPDTVAARMWDTAWQFTPKPITAG